MKHPILILLFPAFLSAQTDTILRERAEMIESDIIDLQAANRDLSKRVDNIQLNLKEHHRAFRRGAGWHVAGIIVSAIAIPVAASGSKAWPVLSGAGGVMAFGGTITMWRSHRYAGKAGATK